jgi:RNA polymerase sigma-70 factor (ECF subfamily)
MPHTCQPPEHAPPPSGAFMAALMRAAQAGERAAYAALLHSIAHAAHQHALSRNATAGEASAYVQSVLMTVHKALPTYDPSRAFWPWLDAILLSRAAGLPRARRFTRLSLPLSRGRRGRRAHPHQATPASAAS